MPVKNIIIKLKSAFSQFKRTVRTVAAVLVAAAAAGTCVWATDYYWTGGGDGSSWNDGRNWNKDQSNYPNALDAQVMIRSDATININEDITVSDLTITNCNATLNLNSNTLNITGTGFGLILGKDPTGGGNTGDATVTINSGTFKAAKVDIGTTTDNKLTLNNSTFDCSGATINGVTDIATLVTTDADSYIVTNSFTIWKGGDATNPTDWNTAANWINNSVPDGSRPIRIPAGCSNYPSLTGDVNVKDIFIESGAKLTTNEFEFKASGKINNKGEITGNILSAATWNSTGTITLTGGGTVTTTGDGGTIKTLNVTSSATIKGGSGTNGLTITDPVSNAITTEGKVTLHGTSITSLTNNGTLTLNGTLSTSGDFTNTGTVDANSKAITVGGNLTNTGTFNNSNTITVNGNFSNTNSSAFSGASIKMTGAGATFAGGGCTINSLTYAPTDTIGTGLTITGNNAFTNFTCTTGGAKITVNGNNTFTNFTCWGANINLTIGSDNTFGTFTCSGENINLTVNGTETVTGNLVLNGANGNPLKIKGSGEFKISRNQSGEYLSIAKSTGPTISAISGSAYYVATDSSFSDSTYGMHNNWIVLNSNMTFTWNGSASTDWERPGNWDCNLVPGLAATTGNVLTQNYDVIIPDSVASGKYPEAGVNDYNIGNLTIGTSSATTHNASLKLNGGSIIIDTTNSKTLTNYGTIFYSGSGRIKDSSSNFINDADNGGTVNFTADASDISAVSYYNLTISGGTGTASGALTVKGDLTVSGGTGQFSGSLTVDQNIAISNNASVSFENNVTVNKKITISDTANASFKNSLTVSDSLTVSASANANFNTSPENTNTSAKTAVFSTTGNVSLGNSDGDTFTVTDDDLFLPSTLGSLTLAGTITAGTTKTITISKSANLAADTTFNSPATIGADITISDDDNSGKLLTCAGTLTSSAHTLTCENISLINLDSAQDAKITFTETAAANQIFTPYEGSAYDTITIDKTNGGSLSVAENKLEVKTLNFTNNKGDITFSKRLTVTTAFSDNTANTGSIEFTEGAVFTPEAVFATSGNVKILTDSTFTGGLTHTAGKTVLPGTITTTNAAINLGTTTLTADTKIIAGTGTVTFGALDSDTDTRYSLDTTGTSGTVTFNGAVGSGNPLSSLIISDTCAVNGGSITTTGVQTYNGKVTINNSDASLTNTSTDAGHFITFNNGISSTDKKLTISSPNSGVLYTGTSPSNSIWSVAGGIVLADTDLFLDGTNTLTLSSDLSCKNFYFYRGSLDTTKNIKTSGDFAVWGSSYNPIDKGWSASNTRFAYYTTGLKRYPAGGTYNSANGTYSTNTSAAFSNLTGAAITVGKNFYVNGADLDAGSFNLTLPSAVTSPAALNTTEAVTEEQWGLPYAAAFNLEVTGCTVTGASSSFVAAGSYGYDGTNAEAVVTSTHGHNVTNGDGNSGWQFYYPKIIEAKTVADNKVYVKFNLPVEYPVTDVREIKYNNKVCSFTDIAPVTADNTKEFYIATTNSRWNTDATGTSTGTSTSTDSNGTHQSVTTDLSILEGVFRAKEGKTMNINYGRQTVAQTYKNVYDATGPVLIAVTTGIEPHTEYDTASGEASQHSYDGHNYIEFKYSEKVNFGLHGEPAFYPAENYAAMENVQVTDSLGGISEFAASSGGTVTVAGLGQIASGLIHTGKDGSDNKYVNALYRNDEYSVRLSVAGWTDGTFTGPDSNEYKKWAGYITKAITPSGSLSLSGVTLNSGKNLNVTDCATELDGTTPLYNPQTLVKSGLTVAMSTIDKDWDTTPPSFAPFRTNRSFWADPALNSNIEYEIIGTSDIGLKLTHVEFHMFGDKPAYDSSENPQWFSRIGWTQDQGGSSGEAGAHIYNPLLESKAADIRNGGIRYSSLYNSQNAFSYSVYGRNNYSTFTRQIIPGAKSSIFTYNSDEPGNTTGGADGHYFRIPLDGTFSVYTRFTIKFNPSDCYLTDLAGNRIQGETITVNSVDRTPPSFGMTASPIGTNKMLIIFSKQLQTETLDLYTLHEDGTVTVTKESALAYIPKSLVLTTESGTGIEIDQNTPAEVAFITNESTGLIITLKQNTVLKDVTSQVFVKTIASPVYRFDPILGFNGAQITYIQDERLNYIAAGSEHAFSDFAIDAVQPMYAYDNTLNQDGTPVSLNLYSEGTYAVHDWDAEQKNYGTISAGKEIIMQTKVNDGTADNSGGAGDVARVSAFFDASPDAESVSTTINSVTENHWRIWLPAEGNVFKNFAPANNTQYVSAEGTAKGPGFVFDLAKETVSSNWKSGDQISFLFMLGDFKIRHNGSSDTEAPLYALRLKNPADITSLDLWSFKLKTNTQQRGGVTILNNVINVDNGENTVIQVNMPEAGNLNVIVMTLDGNIITYLQHGRADAGLHSYNWNGRNKGGNPVARGLYFIRVTGPGIDETRKVMCVK